jgi:ribonuclease VapC
MGCASVIVVDSSVIIAILLNEPEAKPFSQQIHAHEDVMIAAPTIIEIMAVIIPRFEGDAQFRLDMLLQSALIRTVAFDEEALSYALDALLRYGRGRHPAKLNFGDCISYGLAKALGAPLLFKGDDFALTDVKRG